MAPSVALFLRNDAQRLQNNMKTFFGGHPKNGLHEKTFAQKVAEKIFGQVWGNSGKNPSQNPKIATVTVQNDQLFSLCVFI